MEHRKKFMGDLRCRGIRIATDHRLPRDTMHYFRKQKMLIVSPEHTIASVLAFCVNETVHILVDYGTQQGA